MASEKPEIHETAVTINCKIGKWVVIGPNTNMLESSIDDFSYTAGNNEIIYTEIGKFCSIASHACINPGNHPMWRVMQHHATYRRVLYGFAEYNDEDFLIGGDLIMLL